MTNQIDVADTARMIRATLKEAFAKVKFSVRSERFSMGTAIRINWVDGPTESQVDDLVCRYRCKRFDGMTDSTETWNTTLDGEAVHFGGGYISTHREYTDGVLTQGFFELWQQNPDGRYPLEFTIQELRRGAFVNFDFDGRYTLPQAVYHLLREVSFKATGKSPTAARVGGQLAKRPPAIAAPASARLQ